MNTLYFRGIFKDFFLKEIFVCGKNKLKKDKRNNKNIVLGIIPIALIINVIIILFFVFSSNFIASTEHLDYNNNIGP